VMNFLRIDPPVGQHEILLHFDTPLENQVGRLLTAGSLVQVALLLRRALNSTGTEARPAPKTPAADPPSR
jgi:hypothetical protein